MLVLSLRTELPLSEPDEEFGFVTRLDVAIREFDSVSTDAVGTARVAMIHVADAMNRGVPIRAVLDADSEDLLALYEVFFDDELYIKEAFHNGVGLNVMYFEQIEVALPWAGRKIEEAIVRRLVDTWGEGCAVAVMPVADSAEATRWHAMGFELARKAAADAAGFAYLDLALQHPAVTSVDEDAQRFAITE